MPNYTDKEYKVMVKKPNIIWKVITTILLLRVLEKNIHIVLLSQFNTNIARDVGKQAHVFLYSRESRQSRNLTSSATNVKILSKI